MTLRRPPVVASWLFTHLTDPDEGLVGDLIEEYQRRPSRAWYWRQVTIAIVVGFTRGVWTHKLETVQAVFTGFAALAVFSRIAIEPTLALLDSVAGVRRSLPPGSWNSIYMWGGTILWFLAACGAGRLVSRLHPSQRATMVLANVVFLFAWNLPEWYRHVGNALTDSRYTPYLFNSVMYFLIVTAGISAGGLLFRAPGYARAKSM
jgi:hypothetical protein